MSFFKNTIGKLFLSEEKSIPPENRPPLIPLSTDPVPEFRPDPVDICFCGSGEFFKSCCGSPENKRKPPYGIFVHENYLDKSTVRKLVDLIETKKSTRLRVIDNEKSTADNVVTKLDDQRVSERVEMQEHYPIVCEIVKTAFIDLVKQHANKEIEWFEPPQVMRYGAGGYYHGHSDNESFDPEKNIWKRVIDRNFSLLLYLNEDFEGGELFFEKFNYSLQPKAGMAVLFPSDNRYMHSAQTVFEGTRIAIATWAAVKGQPRISTVPPQEAIVL